jgi:hypothetical protein
MTVKVVSQQLTANLRGDFMRITILLTIVGTVLLNLFMAGHVRAQSQADQNAAALLGVFFMKIYAGGPEVEETRLQNLHKAIDKDAAAATSKSYAETLSQQFQVPTSMIEKRRNKKQGWGEITTQLVTAQEVTRSNPETYPTLMDGLGRVEDLRKSGMGWGKITKEMSVNLGSVRKTVERIRNNFRSQSRPAQYEGTGAEKLEKTKRSDAKAQQIMVTRTDTPADPKRTGSFVK